MSNPNATAPVTAGFGAGISSVVPPGAGYGGSASNALSGTFPIATYNEGAATDPTLQWRSEAADPSGKKSADVASSRPTFGFVPNSPFITYVRSNVSTGQLPKVIQQYKPEDRTKLGYEPVKYGIRYDTWSMKHEADIFAEAYAPMVAPRVLGADAAAPQASQTNRQVAMQNLQERQFSSAGPTLSTAEASRPQEHVGTTSASGGKAAQKFAETDFDPTGLSTEKNTAEPVDEGDKKRDVPSTTSGKTVTFA